jgi:Tfp pilus assembly protein PilX
MKNLSRQKGFLSIVAVLIVVVVAVIAVSASYQFTNDSRTSADSLSSAQAYYLAQAGIEAGKHTIITNGNSCVSINGATNYTNATISGASGVFTVTGALTNASSTLNGVVSVSATTIPLVSSSGFTSTGVIAIGNEYIFYTGISGNSLIGVTRGVSGTSAAAYGSGQSVAQTQCVLTSTGFVPNSTSPNGKRILQATIGGSRTFSIGSYSSSVYGVGSVITMTGNSSITNSSVTTSSSNYLGSNITSSGSVSLNGSSSTYVSNGSGGTVVSSDSHVGLSGDIQQNVTAFNAANLFTFVFGQSKTTVKSNANTSYNSGNLDGATFASAGNKVIWIEGDLNLNSNLTVGTSASPVILVVNGNLSTQGGITINGLLYVIGNLDMRGNSTINGFVGIEGNTTSNSGNSSVNYDSGIISSLLTQSNNITSTNKYVQPPAWLQEVLP